MSCKEIRQFLHDSILIEQMNKDNRRLKLNSANKKQINKTQIDITLQEQIPEHYNKHLTDVLRKNSHYKEPSLVSLQHLASEWYVIGTGYDDTGGLNCLCGKEQIRHHNMIKNYHTGIVLHPIGSSCVKRFGIETLDTVCMCCHKKISDNNPFLRAYMKYKPIMTDTLIIAHKKCIKKTFDKAIKYGRWGAYLNPDFVNHFGDLGITVKLDKDDNIDLEYDNTDLTPYMDAICDVLQGV